MGDFNFGNIKWDTLQSTGVEYSTFSPNLIKLGPAVWQKRASVAPPWRSASGHFDQAGSSRLAEARECGAALAISE